jgi:hypothetical protein
MDMKKLLTIILLANTSYAISQSQLDSMFLNFVKPKDDWFLNMACYIHVNEYSYFLHSSCKATLALHGNAGDSVHVQIQGVGDYLLPYNPESKVYFYIYQRGFFPFKKNHLLMVTEDCFQVESNKRRVRSTVQKNSKYNFDNDIILCPVKSE